MRRWLPLLLCLSPSVALADMARLQALGDVGLLIEDSANLFTNPAHAAAWSNRAWFSLGVATTGLDGRPLSVTPVGGGLVSPKDMVSFGVVLNRSIGLYDFSRAFGPVMNAYLPAGPGGPLAGPDGPTETTAPLVFPLDAFVAFGSPHSRLRLGANVYYAGGARRTYGIEDRDLDGAEDETEIVRQQTHLVSVTLGAAGGSRADRVRPEGWLRMSHLSAWFDERAFDGPAEGDASEPTVDRILALDRDLRVGGGARVHVGDVEQGIVVTPALQYDVAFGAFRFDDNLASPDSDAEHATRAATAHDAQLGVGVAWRGEGLEVDATASARVRALQVQDTVADDDERTENTVGDVAIAVPELSLGAEYAVVPALLLRAGIRGTVVGGRTFRTTRAQEGTEDDLDPTSVLQEIDSLDPAVTLQATGGIGVVVRRLRVDAIVGGLVLDGGTAAPNLFSRIDLSFSFD